jgi:hypothetical protein
MKVFCPSCGQSNEGNPGSHVTCAACQTVFDAPGSAPPMALPVSTPTPVSAHPVTTMGSVGSETNPLAIASLVVSLICCIPFNGAIAVGLGIFALKQLEVNPQQKGKELAYAGIGLGAFFLLLSVGGFLFRLIFR